jgi:RPA family protein
VGTVGFVLYFGHRAHVEKRRAELVEKNDLVAIVGKMKGFSREQREALDYIVRSSVTSRVRWNSLFIFWSSIVALVVGIILDFVLA